MKKNLLSIAVCCLSFGAIHAQNNPTADEEKSMKTLATADSGWTKKGSLNLGTTLNYFSQWAAGGINSMGVNGMFNYSANYRKGKNAWDNTFILGYGLINQGLTDSTWVKTDDRLDITSKYGRPIKENLFYAALGNFNTQFAPGYADPLTRKIKISDFMAPARLLIAVGLDYKPGASLSIFFSPITYRGIFVNNQTLADAGAFGVKAAEYDAISGALIARGAKSRTEAGAYFRANYNRKLNESVTFTSKLELFSNYLDKAQNVDVYWDNMISAKLGKNFSLTLSGLFVYDDNTQINKGLIYDEKLQANRPNIGPGLQFKGVTSIGFVHNF